MKPGFCPCCENRESECKCEKFEEPSKLPHFSQLTLSDKALALVLDCVQFAVVATHRRPDVADSHVVETMMLASAALDTFDEDVWHDVLHKLHSAAEEMTDEDLSARDKDGKRV